MPRTNTPGVRRLSAGKAPRKIISSKSGISQPQKGRGSGGGNPYKPRPTPPWQKQIKTFFPRRHSAGSNKENKDDDDDDDDGAGPSSSVMLPVTSVDQRDKSDVEKMDDASADNASDNSIETGNGSGALDGEESKAAESDSADCEQDSEESSGPDATLSQESGIVDAADSEQTK